MNTKEMIAVIQVYIKCRKDIDVEINYRMMDLPKIILAYNIAVDWLNANNIIIKKL